jgi:dTDP-4-amino-4,6-dideoxygalactose transaminase
VQRIIDNTAFIMGPEVERFEHDFAAFCGTKHAVGVSSGTSALHLAFLGCGLEPGDEVITTTFTFIGTTSMMTSMGLKPVFVDIDPDTYNIDPEKIEAAITERTKAIVPVHLYGQPAEMDAILDIAERHGLTVIEDAAQAHGAEYKGRRAGTMGRVAIFSFYPSKNLGAYGDAGMVVTDDDQIAERVRMLRNHGRTGKYEHLIKGYNYRLDALQAAILGAKLPHLEKWNQARRRIANLYRAALADLDIVLPFELEHVQAVYHVFVIRSRRRDELRAHLSDEGISTVIHYPIPLHLQPAYKDLGYKEGHLPVAEECARQVLSLPMYAELSAEQVERVAEAIRAFAS